VFAGFAAAIRNSQRKYRDLLHLATITNKQLKMMRTTAAAAIAIASAAAVFASAPSHLRAADTTLAAEVRRQPAC